MTQYTFDEECYRDLYKSAHGIRPSMAYWNNMTDDEKQADWDSLVAFNEVQMLREREEEQRAIEQFEKNIADCIEMGAKDRATAIKWLMDAEGTNWAEEFCYRTGLPFEMAPKIQTDCPSAHTSYHGGNVCLA